MATFPTISEAAENYNPQNSDPINWGKDDNSVIIDKVNARIADAKGLHTKKCKEWKTADAYLDGEPNKIDPNKEPLIYNPSFPIVRNMTGLVTDAKPNPSVRLVELGEEVTDELKDEMRDTAENLAVSLEEWWDGLKGQSKLQQWIFAVWTYSDYYLMPFWDTKEKEVQIEALKPNRVKIDPNADDICDADYVVADFYRSKQWMYEKYGAEKCKEIQFSDYSEIRIDDDAADQPSEKLLKNVCKLELYMEREKWVYKVGRTVMDVIDNPFWAKDAAAQRNDIETGVRRKYERTGVMGMVDKGIDAVKGVVGMETTNDKIAEDVKAAMANFVPKKNYLRYPRIPVIQFDTYRMAGELYSRSTMMQSIRGIDDINSRKSDIQKNSESMGKPNIFIDGKVMNEDQAKRIQNGKAKGEIVRLNTAENKSLQGSVWMAQGVPVPAQFFDNIEIDKREIDNLWGHHEVSRGGSDPSNQTKGGILALQEADQTPIRYVTRNIEDGLQELFEWVIQIRKMYKPGKYALEAGGAVDYDIIDQHFKVYMKSGSMMPVSKEAQRQEALELWRLNALDPLSLYERLNDPEPEKTAKRLESWLRDKTVMTEDANDQQQKVLEKIKLIQANRFNEVQPGPDDDPKVHHDMLIMALRSNQFTPEQEQFIANLIQQYSQLAGSQPTPASNQQPVVA